MIYDVDEDDDDDDIHSVNNYWQKKYITLIVITMDDITY